MPAQEAEEAEEEGGGEGQAVRRHDAQAAQVDLRLQQEVPPQAKAGQEPKEVARMGQVSFIIPG